MKIHIVQKGDTLWEISKKYGVDFEQLKQVNSHIASPDMIMPGMKIKIPSSSKAVKQTEKPSMQKETKKPYYDITPKPIPVIKEDDIKKKKDITPEMPISETPIPPLPAMPNLDLDLQQLNVHVPVMPIYTPKEEKKVKEEAKPQKPVMKEKEKAPVSPVPLPTPIEQPIYQPMSMYPCFYVTPCHCHPCYPMMPHMGPAFPITQEQDCGCGGIHHFMPQQQMMPPAYPLPHHSHMNSSHQMAQFAGNAPYGETYPMPPAYPQFSPMSNREQEEKEDNQPNE